MAAQPASPDPATLARSLLRHAPPGDADAVFFATVIAKSLTQRNLARSGLAPAELARALDSLFPGALDSAEPALAELGAQYPAYAASGLADPQPGFTLLLRALLRVYGTPASAITPLVTSVLAHACLRPDHLWRDLGLRGREDVTALLTRHYPGLVARNTHNLRWKKFLAYSAFEYAGLPVTAAPGCADCEDHGFCYGAGTAR